jgi:hypothetical protein
MSKFKRIDNEQVGYVLRKDGDGLEPLLFKDFIIPYIRDDWHPYEMYFRLKGAFSSKKRNFDGSHHLLVLEDIARDSLERLAIQSAMELLRTNYNCMC